MKVKMQLDGLVFVDLTEEQEKALTAAAGAARMKDTPQGMKVQGNGKELYLTLYHLSLDYDIEIV